MALKKRQHMSLQVKLDAALIALGLDPASVEWHHSPPLQLRPYEDRDGVRYYEPAENDPRHIVPVGRPEHRERTAKIDIPAIAKTKRLEEAHREFRERLLQKDPATEPLPRRSWRKFATSRSAPDKKPRR
jgi:hypothetical protein